MCVRVYFKVTWGEYMSECDAYRRDRSRLAAAPLNSYVSILTNSQIRFFCLNWFVLVFLHIIFCLIISSEKRKPVLQSILKQNIQNWSALPLRYEIFVLGKAEYENKTARCFLQICYSFVCSR